MHFSFSSTTLRSKQIFFMQIERNSVFGLRFVQLFNTVTTYSSVYIFFHSYLDGVADPGAALEYVRTDLIHSNSSGARKDAEKVIFLFTTGRYKRGGTNPLLPASRLKANGVKIFAVRIPQSPRPYRHHYRRYKRYYYWTSNSFLLQRVASGWLYVLSTSSYLATYRVRRLLNLGKASAI